MSFFVTLFKSPIQILYTLFQYRKLLYSTTKFELQKRYAGSLLGYAWLVLYPLLFLSVYLFLWLVIFKMRFPGYSELAYVVFVFSGLVPFLFVNESIGSVTTVIKQNIHLIKNVIIPIDLIPARVVGVVFPSFIIGSLLITILSAVNGTLSWGILLLPFVMILLIAFILGICLLLAPLGVFLPDLSNIVNLMMTLLMFLSPIAFKSDMVPSSLQLVILVNPISYILEAFRYVFIGGHEVFIWQWLMFIIISLATFCIGASFFQRFKGFVVDYE